MSSLTLSLDHSIRDLDEAVSDFADASFQSCESVLARFVYHLDEEPLAGFLRNVLPAADFQEWLETAKRSVSSFVGSDALNWPAPRPERVAVQISLCRALVNGEPKFLGFVHEYFDAGRSVQAHVVKFAQVLLQPLVRDIARLAEQRPIPPVLFEAMGTLPTSGDSILDSLISDAGVKFRDPSPKARLEATQTLWDAWERLKSLEAADDKRLSVKLLLGLAAADPPFRATLETEAKEITRIGNDFHIRHFEANRSAIERPEQVDYLFHRLFALIHLLLFARRSDA